MPHGDRCQGYGAGGSKFHRGRLEDHRSGREGQLHPAVECGALVAAELTGRWSHDEGGEGSCVYKLNERHIVGTPAGATKVNERHESRVATLQTVWSEHRTMFRRSEQK